MLAFTDTKLLDTAFAFNWILALSQASITTEPVGVTVGVAPTPTVTVLILVHDPKQPLILGTVTGVKVAHSV